MMKLAAKELFLGVAMGLAALSMSVASHAKVPAEKEVRAECTAKAKDKGLKGAERKEAIKACVADGKEDRKAKRKALAKDCRDQATNKGLKGDERKAFVKACKQK